MKFINTYQIDDLVRSGRGGDIFRKAVRLLADLRDLADAISDGWHSWPKPARAANRLVELVETHQPSPRNGWRATEPTPAELKKAVVPIKSFITRNAKVLVGRTLEFPC